MLEAATICAIGLTSGAVCTLFVRRMTDADQLRSAINSMIASLFEFRLFADQPSVLLKAQWRLIAANARVLRLLTVPSLILLLPYWGLLATADGIFGRLPLKSGESTVVTVQFRNAGNAFANAKLEASSGFDVETPGVRVKHERQVSWRARALKAEPGQFLLHINGRTVAKSISAASGFRVLSDERGGTFWSFATHPLELPLLDPEIEFIRVAYPVDRDWLIWFCFSSFAGALLPLYL